MSLDPQPHPWRWPEAGLYALVDPAQCAGRDPLWVADAILEGGCSLLQLRVKRGSDRDTLALARELGMRCRARDVPFFVNDRVDLALLAEVDGLHLGQEDLPLADVRGLASALQTKALRVGLSTHSLAQALQAVRDGADLIGFGPVFATSTKEQADPVVGLQALSEVVRAAAVPVVAIGGIDTTNAHAVRRAGARWGACISAVCASSNPSAAAAELHAQLGASLA